MKPLCFSVPLSWGLPLLFAPVLSSCVIKPERDYPNLLDHGPRVLGIRSSLAEIPLGESADLDALVFVPEASGSCADEEIEYSWSWCPMRGDAEEGFPCLMTEQEFLAFFDTLGLEGDPPDYDLGNEPTVSFENVTGQFPQALCMLQLGDSADDSALRACVSSLVASVSLRATWCDKTETAIKSLSLLDEDTSNDEDYVPNQNPDPAGNMQFFLRGSAQEGDLQQGATYEMRIELASGEQCRSDDDPEDCVAETFLPEPLPGQDQPLARRETLVMSWFLTKGNTAPDELDGEPYEPDTGSQEGQFTFFSDDPGELEPLLGNLLALPDAEPGPGEIIVVLRDERGGVGWARFGFSVTEAD